MKLLFTNLTPEVLTVKDDNERYPALVIGPDTSDTKEVSQISSQVINCIA